MNDKDSRILAETYSAIARNTLASPSDIDPHELSMGIRVEMEHTKDKQIAEKIARDHLAENPKYYTILKSVKL